MLRIYLSTLGGDGLTLPTAFYPIWKDLVGHLPSRGVFDSKTRGIWIGQIDTTDTQHQILIADNRVRSVPTAILGVTLTLLNQNQRDAIEEVFTWLGVDPAIFSGSARVRDVLQFLVGWVLWRAAPLIETG